MKKIKYGLDVDGVLLEFDTAFIKECKKHGIILKKDTVWNFFEQDVRSYDVFHNLDSSFWLNLKRTKKSENLKIIPTVYISHRNCPEEITKQSLIKAGFPDVPVIHVKHTEDKVKVAKQLGVDIFIDDRGSTVMYFLENGMRAYVLDYPYNDYFNLPRIYTLGELEEYEIKQNVKSKSKSNSKK